MTYNPTSPNGTISSRRGSNRNNNRYSVTALYSMAAEQDVEVEDDLGRGARLHTLSLTEKTPLNRRPSF
jgi:Ras GTPase-activating-like protein IQGAP2/3